MPKVKITFQPANKTVEINSDMPVSGHDGLPGSILAIALANGIKLEHACGGNCACTTCHVIIKKGAENLSPQDDFEADLIDKAPGVTLSSRLACQAVVKSGEVVVEIPRFTINQDIRKST